MQCKQTSIYKGKKEKRRGVESDEVRSGFERPRSWRNGEKRDQLASLEEEKGLSVTE